jgi:hypothetical protein
MGRAIRIPLRGKNPRRAGITLVEALVMILIVGTCMVPIVGTLQVGMQRVDKQGQNVHMRLLAESKLNEGLADVYFNGRTPAVGTTTVAWPEGGPPEEQVATYLVNVAMTGRISIANKPGAVAPNAIGLQLVGSQPRSLNEVFVTVYQVNTDPDLATETLRISSMVAFPTYETLNRIFLADPTANAIMVADPFVRKAARQFINVSPMIPGNIAVHPNGKWLFMTTKSALYAVDINSFSDQFSMNYQIFAEAGTEFLATEDLAGARAAVGIAFRPDGRYCYVTTVKDASCGAKPSLAIFEVPHALPASLTKVKSLPSGGFPTGTTCRDMHLGEDGRLYLARSEANKIYRLSMVLDPAQCTDSDLETYVPTFNTYTVAPVSVVTSRGGREIFALWPGTTDFYSWSASENPGVGNVGTIGRIDGYGPAPSTSVKQATITRNNNWVLISQDYNYGGTPAKYYIPMLRLPPSSTTTNSGGNMLTSTTSPTGPHEFLQNAVTGQNGNPSFFALASPKFSDIAFSYDQGGSLVFANRSSALNGDYRTGLPTDRVVSLKGKLDGAVTARPIEEILVGTSNGVSHSLQRIDLYALDGKKKPYLNDLASVTLPAKSAFLSTELSGYYAATKLSGNGIGIYDLGTLGLKLSLATDWAARSGIFLFNRSMVVVNSTGSQYRVYKSPDGWLPDPSAFYTETLPSTYMVKDVVPLNNGGAFVLATNWTPGPLMATHSTILHWIGPDHSIFARWDSRFDPGFPQVSTHLAVSPDDSLLALLVPDFEGGSAYYVDFFDLRSQDFGSQTTLSGVIREIRNDSSKNFLLSNVANTTPIQSFTGTGIRLQQALTAFGDYTAEPVFGLNFLGKTGTKYVTRTTKSFGYLHVPREVRAGLGWDDAMQWYLDGERLGQVLGATGNPYTAGFQQTIPLSIGANILQVNVTDGGAPAGAGLFFNNSLSTTKFLLPGDFLDYSVCTDSVRLSSTGTSNGWYGLSASSFRPMRLAPPFLTRWVAPDFTTYDGCLLSFDRHMATPKLYVVNAPEGMVHRFTWGAGDTDTFTFATGTTRLASGSAVAMAISPDNNRLLIAANAVQPTVLFVDISLPETASHGVIIASQTLDHPVTSLAMRPFNRVFGRTNCYEELATMPISLAGSQLAGLAHGGIVLAGGAADAALNQSPHSDAVAIDPGTGSIIKCSGVLSHPVAGQTAVSYDGNLVTMGGKSSSSPVAFVQQWNTRTGKVIPALDGLPDRTLKVQNPQMTSNTVPTGYLVTGSSYRTKDYIFGKKVHYDCFRAFDYDEGFPWFSKETLSMPQWLQFDFPLSKTISAISLFGSDQAIPRDFALYGSNSNDFTTAGAFATVLEGRYTSFTRYKRRDRWYAKCQPQFFPFSNETAFKNYRLRIFSAIKPDGASLNFVGISELALMGFDPYEMTAKEYMASLTVDVQTTYAPRLAMAGCLTPYGIMFSGGSANGTTAVNSVSVLWPHGLGNTVPNNSDVRFWMKFDEQSGTMAFDSSFNKFTGTLVNGPTWVAGKKDNALYFNGFDQHVRIDQPGIVSGLSAYSICFWVNIPAHVNAQNAFRFYLDSNTSTDFELGEWNGTQYLPRFEVISGGVTQSVQGNAQIPVGDWQHIAVTFSGTTGRMYLNGNQIGINSSMTNTPAGWGGTTIQHIGKAMSGDPMKGSLDEFLIFSRALTLNEVMALADNKGIRGWWKCDEGTGTSVKDSSGRFNYHATLNGGWDTGIFDKCVKLSGSSQGITFPNAAPKVTVFSLSCWVKSTTSSQVSGARIFEAYVNASNYACLMKGSSGKLRFYLYNGTKNGSPIYCTDTLCPSYPTHIIGYNPIPNTYTFESSETFDTLFPSNSWRHVVLTINSSGLVAVYVDTVQKISGSCTNPDPKTSNFNTLGTFVGVWAGRGYSSSTEFAGMIDDIMMFQTILNTTQITDIFNASLKDVLSAVMAAKDKPSPNRVEDTGNRGSDYQGWKAFDGKTDKWFCLPEEKMTGRLIYDFGPDSAKAVSKLVVNNNTPYGTDRGVKSFKFYGSQDKSNWTLLTTQSSVPQASTNWTCYFSNTTEYRYYAFDPSANHGDDDYCGIVELQLCGGYQPYVPTTVPDFEPQPQEQKTSWGITRQVCPMNSAASRHALIYHKGFVYRIGGSSTYPSITLLSHINRYDFNTNTWTTVAGTPYPYVDFGACSFGDEIFFFGGADASNNAVNKAVAWNPTTNKARTLPNLPTPRHSCAAVAAGPHIYIMGGTTTPSAVDGNTVYRYTP